MKTSYLSVRTKSYIQLFGYFLESKLARMIVYPKGTTNITNSPSWEEYSGKAEDVAFAAGSSAAKAGTAPQKTTARASTAAISFLYIEFLSFILFKSVK